MKSKYMRTPNLQEIFTHKSQYENHKKKLHRIYEDRKSQLGYDSLRMRQFVNIKQNKTKSFINKFNKQTDSIAKQNMKLLGKLQNVKPSLSRRSLSEQRERYTYSYINPHLKQRMLETEKQNLRISNKMKNMSSSLNQKSFMRDYAKSQQIKNRLMRYAIDNDNSKVCLKSERYLNTDGDNSSVISQPKEEKKLFKVKISNHRKSAITHYKRQQILKNKIDNTTNLAAIKAKNKYRPNTSFQDGKNPQQSSFFTTQPKRQRPYFKKRNIH